MVQSILLKILLAPFALLYGIGAAIHRFLYQKGVLKTVAFDVPVISIGNLSVGGAGKTPHTEYIIRLLKDYLNVATLSRGYKRKTKGFLEVHPGMTAEQAGDEPLQFKRKFPDITVAVGENRVLAIPEMLANDPALQVVLLDDAYQHRAVQPGFNILLTTYDLPFTRDYLLPSGTLREWRSAYERADLMIVTKCPANMTVETKAALTEEIKPLPRQKLFFSYYDYGYPYYIFNPSARIRLEEDVDIILLCAIAKTEYLEDYLKEQAGFVGVKSYEDHHFFSRTELSNLKTSFERLESKKKIIITTEKDAMRLELHRSFLIKHRLPIFVLPVEVKFLFEEGAVFDETLKQFLLNFKV